MHDLFIFVYFYIYYLDLYFFKCINRLTVIREIHPLDPQPHRYCMLVPRVCAPRVTRCSLGKFDDACTVPTPCLLLPAVMDMCTLTSQPRHRNTSI